MSLRVTIRAEEYLSRFKTEDPDKLPAACLWFCRDVLNWAPNGLHQIYWVMEMLKQLYTLLFSVPRGGKTMCVEAVNIYEMAINPKEDLRIYAPKLDQAKEALKYHYDWIDASDVLKAFLRTRNGKPIFSTESYEFANHSIAKGYSIMGNMEAVNVTIARVEEFDDWSWERFANDMPRRMGAAGANGKPTRVRITGTIMGEENIFRLLNDPNMREMFKNLSENAAWATEDNPKGLIDVWMLTAFGGILDETAINFARNSMSPDEWARSYLLLFTESKNYIRRKYLRRSQKLSLEFGIDIVPLRIGDVYIRQPGEIISIGLDCGHAGQGSDSSVYSLQVNSEMRIGYKRYIRWMAGFNWEPTVNSDDLERGIMHVLEFYRPDGGYGDALKSDLIQRINRKAYERGLTSKNPDDYPENMQSNWKEWYIIPLWNTDKAKHDMYSTMQGSIHAMECFFPYIDRYDDRPEAAILNKLLIQLEGIRQTKNKGKYPSYNAESSKIGDDDADANGMGMLWLAMNAETIPDFGMVKAHGARTHSLADISRF